MSYILWTYCDFSNAMRCESVVIRIYVGHGLMHESIWFYVGRGHRRSSRYFLLRSSSIEIEHNVNRLRFKQCGGEPGEISNEKKIPQSRTSIEMVICTKVEGTSVKSMCATVEDFWVSRGVRRCHVLGFYHFTEVMEEITNDLTM